MQFETLRDYSLSAKPKVKPQTPEPKAAPLEDLPKELKSLNLDSELLIQYQNAKALYGISYQDPTNQRTAVLNTITSILAQIVKLQTDLYDAEYTKRIESTLIKTLKQFPDLQAEFFKNYEAALNV